MGVVVTEDEVCIERAFKRANGELPDHTNAEVLMNIWCEMQYSDLDPKTEHFVLRTISFYGVTGRWPSDPEAFLNYLKGSP